MTSILYRASSGVAGDVTRPDNTVVEPGLLNAAKAPTAFGAPVKIVSGKFEKKDEITYKIQMEIAAEDTRWLENMEDILGE